MKRSKMIQNIANRLDSGFLSEAEDMLDLIEQAGMSPPGVKVKKMVAKDYKWGAMCSMSCNCEDCNPDFIVYEWEPEG